MKVQLKGTDPKSILAQSEELLDIDDLALDEELCDMPQLTYNVGAALAEANSAVERAKHDLTVTDAEKELDIRAQYESQKMKVTEGKIKADVLASDEHKRAFDEWLEAKEFASKLSELRNQMSTKHYSCRDLVKLFLDESYQNREMRVPEGSRERVAGDNRARLARARKRHPRPNVGKAGGSRKVLNT